MGEESLCIDKREQGARGRGQLVNSKLESLLSKSLRYEEKKSLGKHSATVQGEGNEHGHI